MGWTTELYAVYEAAAKDPKSGLLPGAHSTANAQIELTIDEHGMFKDAHTIAKEDAVTIIPVTEDSGSRTSGISAMPLADKLMYLAGDYGRYVENKRAAEANSAYLEQLSAWANNDLSHPAVRAVLAYLQKGCLMEDLVKSGVLQTEEDGRLKEGAKINAIAQTDAFVRFIVLYDALGHETRTWCDTTLYDSFQRFNARLMGNEKLCYATGTVLPVTYKHPSKIRNAGDKAKLISSNDESGFTYRGRFADKEEALSVSYDFSQKVHNALKWLIQRQGQSYGSLSLVTWATALAPVPDPVDDEPDDDWDEEEHYSSLPLYRDRLRQHILGYGTKLPHGSKVMILGLDAATTGRLSVALYDELLASDFLKNVERWHADSAWMRYDGKRKVNCIKSFSLFDIIRAAYGSEKNGRLECDDKLVRDQILRLLPCVTDGRPVPVDLICVLHQKASHPLSYEHGYCHRIVLETVCGMYRVSKKGEIPMGFDPNETDRSYLYGCLLAIADKAESDTYDEADKAKRVTNARRYWANFAQRPYQTWQTIEERLRPYLDRSGYRVQVEKLIQSVMGKFTPGAFADNSRLDTMYLLGYHHFTAYMYDSHKKEEN